MISPAIQRRLEEVLQAHGRGTETWPDIDEALLVFLEALYPPRCLQPNETVEDHLRYAGAASLIQDLRYHFTLQREAEASAEGDGQGEISVEIV